MADRPSRSNRPWELRSGSRPVWAYPVCPDGHGRIFVGGDDSGALADYRCHAPWCEIGAFDAPEGWEQELEAEIALEVGR